MIKLQIGCMIMILFIAVIYFPAKRVKSYSHILFSLSLGTTGFNLIFDMITVYTVNHLDTVPEWFNWVCHILFLGSLILEIFICYLYSTTLIYDDDVARRKNRFMVLPVCIAWLGLIILPLRYVQTPRGNYSWGPAVNTLHGIVIFFFIFMLATLIRHWKEINSKKRFIVLLAFMIQGAVLIYQSIFPLSLITSAGLTLINLAFFLTVESPDVLLMEQLKEEKDRADEANAAKSQFLSNMSHEIRTPMNAIVGLTEVLLRKEWPEEETRYLYNIKRSGDALLGLINDLLDFSKIESGKFTITEEDYEPLGMVEDLRLIFQNRIGDKPIDLQYDIDPKLPKMLFGDGIRIRQIIINLVNNAIKFTDAGYVRLSVQVKRERLDAVELKVSVQDTGQGIREEDLNKLFDAFTQVELKKNHAKEGSGLGLAICRQLVELMGGTLQVSSEYGKGSDFNFTLWQKSVSGETVGDCQDRKPEKRLQAATEFAYSAPEARVLLVDDNEINREVAIALLEPLKMQIDVAANGLEAFEMIQQEKYDMVFMDHYMPVMDGVEAATHIRELKDGYYKQVPILALTADAVAGEQDIFFAAGMNDVVSKPIRINEICEKIRYYMAKELIVENTGERMVF